MSKDVLIVLNDMGGAVINWCFNEITGTLRAQMCGHPPIVVLNDERDNDRHSKNEGGGERQISTAEEPEREL